MNGILLLAVIVAATAAIILWVEHSCRESEKAMRWVDEQYAAIDEEFKDNDNPVGPLPWQWRGDSLLSWPEARRMVAQHRKFAEVEAANRAAQNSNNKEAGQ